MRKVGFTTKFVAAALMTAVPVASSAVAAVRPGSALAGSANSISLAGVSAVQGNSEEAPGYAARGGLPLIPLFVILATIAVGIWIASDNDNDNDNSAISLG